MAITQDLEVAVSSLQDRTTRLEAGKADLSLVQHLEVFCRELALRISALETPSHANPMFLAPEGALVTDDVGKADKMTGLAKTNQVSTDVKMQPPIAEEVKETVVPDAKEEEAAQVTATIEESRKKKLARAVSAVTSKHAVDEDGRGEETEIELVHKMAGQDDAQRKRSAGKTSAEANSSEDEHVAIANAPEGGAARKKALPEEGQHERALEEERASRAEVAEGEFAGKRAAVEEGQRKMAVDEAVDTERVPKAAEKEKAAHAKAAEEGGAGTQEGDQETSHEALIRAIKLTNMNKGHESQEKCRDTMKAALHAAEQLQAAGEESDYDLAMHLAERAEQALERSKASILAANGQGGEGAQPQGMSDRPRGNPRMNPLGPPQFEPVTMNRKSRQIFADNPFEPDQNVRRQQLRAAAAAANAPPTIVHESSSNGLRDVLQSVRPDWTLRDVQSVQEKLGKIKVSTTDDLFWILLIHGGPGVNKMLKDAGQKVLKIETLEALHAKAMKVT